MDASDARKLKTLEDENAKLKKLLAEAMLDNAILKDVASKNGDASCEAGCGGSCLRTAWGEPASGVRGAVVGSIENAIPQRAAQRCLDPRGDEEAGERASPLRLSAHPRDAGPAGNRYELEEASASLSGGKADGAQARRPRAGLGNETSPGSASRPSERWSLDCVSDAFTDGRRFRVLAVVDDFTRECLCLVADTSLSGARLARELDGLITRRGKPKTIVSDNGTEMHGP
jgi:putative transposase